jgi:hypothetical protein
MKYKLAIVDKQEVRFHGKGSHKEGNCVLYHGKGTRTTTLDFFLYCRAVVFNRGYAKTS